MKITGIETYRVRIPLKPEYLMITALGRHDVSEYVLVRLQTDQGVEGVGEATVSPSWSGETPIGTVALIKQFLAPAVIGLDPRDAESVSAAMDAVARHNWFAKSAIEMACWDAYGKAEAKPVYELLGGARRDPTIRCRFSLGAYDADRAQSRAAEILAQGFTTLKVKVGGEPETDIARVRAVRKAIGPEPTLVLDANCGWTADTAIDCLHALSDCNIRLMEQPTPDGDYLGMARVRHQVWPEIMADDICFNLHHAETLIRNDCCDVISVYPGKNGGIQKAQRIAEFAGYHGVACTIGSNLEYDIATAAMGHLVIATENIQVEAYPGDMLGPAYHQAGVARNPLKIEGPQVTISDRPGLGVDVDWEQIKKLSVTS
ncbi:mandelate racemase/muconate lactonizing enzyme family protein [Lignipirellula cremea]|uniref:L-Ala-D/L-Glu epimerase n=1 Tax=Lignipirellula cremea TaxID=2528010 RepID=A0A518DNB4_9BACT|nr:enolase C-terminal domain-like protein [Lignipirellula cremea]QDU93324.1 L-Ala-D/L-Glu epimerase [Lignipirellula cremea]